MKLTTRPNSLTSSKQLANAKAYKNATLNYIEANLTLHKIGNQLPYFSLTGRAVVDGIEAYSGTIHEEILSAFPELEDAAPLHLSDINGQPIHSFENGKYWAGFTQWQKPNAKALAKLWRISEKRAEGLLFDALALQSQEIQEDTGEFVHSETLLKEFHDRQLRRWKQEAEHIIKKYNLEVE